MWRILSLSTRSPGNGTRSTLCRVTDAWKAHERRREPKQIMPSDDLTYRYAVREATGGGGQVGARVVNLRLAQAVDGIATDNTATIQEAVQHFITSLPSAIKERLAA